MNKFIYIFILHIFFYKKRYFDNIKWFKRGTYVDDSVTSNLHQNTVWRIDSILSAESENHKKMFFYRAARSWNNLPSYLKECTNLDNFKKSLKYYIRNAAHDLIWTKASIRTNVFTLFFRMVLLLVILSLCYCLFYYNCKGPSCKTVQADTGYPFKIYLK